MTSEVRGRHDSPKKESVEILNRARDFLRSEAVGMDEAAEAVGQQLLRRPEPLVLVLGEPGRGKTSVVKLLAPHRSSPAEEVQLAERFRRVAPPATARCQSMMWLDVNGEAAALPDEETVGAEVPWDSCRLGDEVVVVDAPCRGGVTGSQAVLNKSLAAGATTAVFVTDAGAPLSKPEVDYLRDLLNHLDSLTVVVTKTDLFPESWAQVVATNTEILVGMGRRQVPVLELSATMAEYALGHTDPFRSAMLTQKSGLDQICRQLRHELGRGELVPHTSALLAARRALGQQKQVLVERLAVVRSAEGQDLAELLEERRERLASLRETEESWREYFNRDMQILRTNFVEEATSRLEVWEVKWCRELEQDRKLSRQADGRAATGERMLAELAALHTDVLAAAENRLALQLLGWFETIADPGAPGLEVVDRFPELGGLVRGAMDHTLRGASKGPLDLTVIMQGVFGMSLVGRLGSSALGALTSAVGGAGAAGTISLGSIFGLGIPIVAGGLAYMTLLRRFRQATEDLRTFLGEVRRVARDERARLVGIYDGTWNQLRPDVVLTYQRQLRTVLKQADAGVKDAVMQEKRSVAGSATRAAEITEDLRAVELHITRVDQSLDRLREAHLASSQTRAAIN